MFRRFLSMSLALCLSFALAVSVRAASQISLSLDAPAGAKPGDMITVKLFADSGQGVSAAQFTLAYDEAVLDCVSCETGPALTGMMSASNPDANTGAIIAAASAANMNIDGAIGVYTFKVLKEGNYGFRIADVIFADTNGTNIDYKVEITGDSSSEPDEPPVEEPQQKPVETPDQETEQKPSVPSGGDSATKPEETPEQIPTDTPTFTDTVGHWAEAYIKKAAELGLVNGIGNNLYSPDSSMTRSEFVTILWRNAGSPEPSDVPSFSDVTDSNTYYYKAVAWAEEHNVVNGIGNGQFGINALVTREQIATILYRLSGSQPGGETMWYSVYDQTFTDSDKISDWAKQALYWSVYSEIWCGVGAAEVGTMLSPGDWADRAQIAVFMTRYNENYERGGANA